MVQTIELAEYQSRREKAPDPTEDDLALAERLSLARDREPRIEVRWLAGGKVDITTTSWVGIVRFSALEIQVVPKLVGGTLRVLQMLEYAAGVRLLRHLPMERQRPHAGPNLFDLIVKLLVGETRTLIRDGLIRDYRAVDDTLAVLRGRLRMREQFLRRYASLHRLECSFDEYDGDIPENQLLSAALTAAATHVDDTDLKTDTSRLAHTLANICEPQTRDADSYVRRIHYGRRNARYRPAHELAILVLRGLAVADLFDTSLGRITAFMLNMNTVFEQFVSRLVADSLEGSGLEVSAKESLSAVIIDEDTGNTYSTLRPDLVVFDSRRGHKVPIDIKYKLYDIKKVSSADVYQTFLYAYALSGNAEPAAAGVIYPAAVARSGPRLRVTRTSGSSVARIRGAGLNISSILEELAGPDPAVLHAEILATVQAITGLSDGNSAPRVVEVAPSSTTNSASF